MNRAERGRAAALKAGLAQLPERQRTIFHTVAVDGLSYADAAERLGMSTAEIERQLAAALVALDRTLATNLRQTVWHRLAQRFVPRPSS